MTLDVHQPEAHEVIRPLRRRSRRRADDPTATTRPCECGHAAEAHEHYRPGSECGACGGAQCAAFRSA